MTETRTAPEPDNLSVSMLRLTAEHLKQIKFQQLVRPALGPDSPPTIELLHWAIQAYCFPWIRHMSALLNGIILLTDSDNKAAVRIVGRSSFEFCAHAYYVKKHMKQHLDRKDLTAAWNFLLPIATGSRYINEYHHPEESDLFPAGPHISQAVNCFKEVMPKGMDDDYSYLSEFCHPNNDVPAALSLDNSVHNRLRGPSRFWGFRSYRRIINQRSDGNSRVADTRQRAASQQCDFQTPSKDCGPAWSEQTLDLS